MVAADNVVVLLLVTTIFQSTIAFPANGDFDFGNIFGDLYGTQEDSAGNGEKFQTDQVDDEGGPVQGTQSNAQNPGIGMMQNGGFPGMQPGGFPGMQTGGFPGMQTGGFPGMQTGGLPGMVNGNPGGSGIPPGVASQLFPDLFGGGSSTHNQQLPSEDLIGSLSQSLTSALTAEAVEDAGTKLDTMMEDLEMKDAMDTLISKLIRHFPELGFSEDVMGDIVKMVIQQAQEAVKKQPAAESMFKASVYEKLTREDARRWRAEAGETPPSEDSASKLQQIHDVLAVGRKAGIVTESSNATVSSHGNGVQVCMCL